MKTIFFKLYFHYKNKKDLPMIKAVSYLTLCFYCVTLPFAVKFVFGRNPRSVVLCTVYSAIIFIAFYFYGKRQLKNISVEERESYNDYTISVWLLLFIIIAFILGMFLICKLLSVCVG